MISAVVQIHKELLASLNDASQYIDNEAAWAIVKDSSEGFKTKLAAGYSNHILTGDLQRSISTFQRRKKTGGYLAYFVGPRYSTGSRRKGTYQSLGGQAAHLIEYGTVQRFVANKSKGGASFGKGRAYGAKSNRGIMPGFGVIRKTYDENASQIGDTMQDRFLRLIDYAAKKKGLQT